MNEDIEQLLQPLKRDGLTRDERENIRRELRVFMAEHPVREEISAWSWTSMSLHRFASGAVAFALVLTVGAGTSYAAEGTLPGDLLYPIKLGVNERVAGALASGPKAKATWHAERATRRLEEVETLAASGRLDATTSAEVHENLERSAKDFDNVIAAVAEEGGAEAVAGVQSDFEATLTAHAKVLAALSDSVPSAKSHIDPILRTVEVRERGAERSREGAEREMARGGGEKLRTAVNAKKAAAAGKLKEMKALSESSLSNATTSVAASVGATVGEQAFQTGDQTMGEGDLGKAYTAFQAAIRVADEAKVNAKAHERLRDRVQLPALGVEDASTSIVNVSLEIDADRKNKSENGKSGEGDR